MKEVVCLIPTWFTAGHAKRAADSIRKYYPTIPIFFVDDEIVYRDVDTWQKLNPGGIPDTDPSDIANYPLSNYILNKHEGYETEGHGKAVTEAMKSIFEKWVIHLSADARIIKEGIIEYMMDGVNDTYCGIGQDFSRGGKPNVGKWLCMFRGDLYHKYKLNWLTTHGKADAGQNNYFGKLVDKGYNIKYLPGAFKDNSGFNEYFIHLTNVRPGHEKEWEQYYE